MTRAGMNPVFSDALRSAVVDHVRATSRPTKRRRVWLWTGAFLGACMLGTAGAVASGLFPLPGGESVTDLAAPVIESHTGTATVELGSPPKGATHVVLELACLTSGRMEFPDGASMSCTEADAGTRGGISTYSVRMEPSQQSVTITAEAEVRWRLTATYVNQMTTEWGLNAAGDTYGVQNDRGVPDLIAVIATNGRQGYAKRGDLEAADGTTAAQHFKTPEDALRWQEANEGKSVSIPVYQEDGTTVIGEFVIGPQ